MSDVQVISDPSDLKKYRTELPNLYDDSDLDVYEHRLLCHYKRVGECTESLETTAKKCKMSEGKGSEARRSLADKGWITLEEVRMDKGENGRYRYIVRVVDRWIENFAKYSKLSVDAVMSQVKRVYADKANPSPHEASPSPDEATPSPHDGKKELFKKEPIKKNDERFAQIAQKLALLSGGALNATSADLISTWLEKHANEWIIKAIEIAIEKKARSEKYVDSILIGWEANGYPKTRAEKVQDVKQDGSKKPGATSSSKNKDIIRKVAQNANRA